MLMFDFRKPVWRHSIDIPLHDGLNADPGPYVFGGNNDIPVTIGPGVHEAGLNHFSGSAQPVRNPPVSNYSVTASQCIYPWGAHAGGLRRREQSLKG